LQSAYALTTYKKPVNLADPDGPALVGHLLEAAQRLGHKVE
jgi:hypothetical protein